jgi:hypothetical protein
MTPNHKPEISGLTRLTPKTTDRKPNFYNPYELNAYLWEAHRRNRRNTILQHRLNQWRNL